MVGDFALCYLLGVLVAPLVAPIVDVYAALFGFVLHPPTLNPFDYPRP